MRGTPWIAVLALTATLSPARAADASRAEGSGEARVWFERALGLDIGAGGAPDAIQAFAAMRRAAEAGDPQAAFNVAVMLDSGRGAARNVAEAAIWYARAAARGVRRGGFNLGLLYQIGEGVPANVDLSRAWYAAANLPAARERLAELRSPADRPAHVQAPKPLFPVGRSLLQVDDQQVDLVWTSFLEPEPVRFFVELRGLDAHASSEVWSGFVDVSSMRLPLPSGFRTLAWRVTAVTRGSADYAVSGWSIFSVPQAAMALDNPKSSSSETSDGDVRPPEAADREKFVSREPRNLSERQPEKRDPSAAISDDAPTGYTSAPTAKPVVNSSRSDRPEDRNPRFSHEDRVAQIAPPSRDAVQESDRAHLPAVSADHTSVAPLNAPAVLIILAQMSVTSLSDLNNKAVVVAGLTSISRTAVDSALTAAGAGAAQVTEGTKSDIDKLLDGKVSAAIVACVTPAKAGSFPETVAGLRVLRVTVTDPGDLVLEK